MQSMEMSLPSSRHSERVKPFAPAPHWSRIRSQTFSTEDPPAFGWELPSPSSLPAQATTKQAAMASVRPRTALGARVATGKQSDFHRRCTATAKPTRDARGLGGQKNLPGSALRAPLAARAHAWSDKRSAAQTVCRRKMRRSRAPIREQKSSGYPEESGPSPKVGPRSLGALGWQTDRCSRSRGARSSGRGGERPPGRRGAGWRGARGSRRWLRRSRRRRTGPRPCRRAWWWGARRGLGGSRGRRL